MDQLSKDTYPQRGAPSPFHVESRIRTACSVTHFLGLRVRGSVKVMYHALRWLLSPVFVSGAEQ